MPKIKMQTALCPSFEDAFERFIIAKKAKGLSDKSIATYNNHYNVIYYPNGGAPDTGAALGFPEVGSKNTWWAEACMTGQTGGSAAHNNMPPYLAVYIWKRTA